jgi:hypothetical protein
MAAMTRCCYLLDRMQSWKKLVAIGVGIGAGIVLMLCITALLWRGWTHRERALNHGAITAEYAGLDTDEPSHNVAFLYTLSNNTGRDYRITGPQNVQFAGRLKSDNSLLFQLNGADRLQYPIYIPARGRVRVSIHSAVGYTSGGPTVDSDQAWKEFNAQLAKFVIKEMPNLAGFSILDLENRYQIDLPAGWEKPSSSSAVSAKDQKALEGSSHAKEVSPITGDVFDRIGACNQATDLLRLCRKHSVISQMPQTAGGGQIKPGEIVALPEPPKGYTLDADPATCAIAESWIPTCRSQKLLQQ